MKPDQNDGEIAQKKLNDWKSLAENLNIILQYEAVQIKDEFENQKKNLYAWLESVYDNLHTVKDLSEDKALKFRSSMESLRVQAALGKAETADALKEQQQKISDGIQQLLMDLNDAFDSSKEEIRTFAEEVAEKSNDFHTRFDLFKLQLYLGKEETKEDWEKKKKEISKELHALNAKLANGYDNRAENWDHFSNEMSEAWGHIKQSFTLQTKTKS